MVAGTDTLEARGVSRLDLVRVEEFSRKLQHDASNLHIQALIRAPIVGKSWALYTVDPSFSLFPVVLSKDVQQPSI